MNLKHHLDHNFQTNNMKVFVALFAVMAVTVADNTPTYKPAPSYHEPQYSEPAYYNYGYEVVDDYSGVNFGAKEDRNDKVTTGSYHVLLPDGRTQTVTYTVDGYNGYVADVQYSGYAKEYKAAPAYKPKSTYKPKPTYKPAPSYKPTKPTYNA